MVWTQGHGNVQAIEEAQRDVIAMVHDFTSFTSQSRPSHTCHPHARVEARLLQFMALILGKPKHFFDQSPGSVDHLVGWFMAPWHTISLPFLSLHFDNFDIIIIYIYIYIFTFFTHIIFSHIFTLAIP